MAFIFIEITEFLVGIMQWLVLRKSFYKAGWWILANVAGLGLGFGLTSLLEWWESGFMTLILLLTSPIFITGLTMLWLLQKPKP